VGDFDIECIVLDRRNYRDRDLLLNVLSPDRGSLRGVFRAARGGRAPRAAAAEVLSLVRVRCYKGRNAELFSFRDVEIEISSFPLSTDFLRVSAAAVIAEALAAFCPPEEPAPRRFRLGRAVLDGLLQSMDARTAIAYTWFWLLRFGGLMPEITYCEACGKALDNGVCFGDSFEVALCPRCAGSIAQDLDQASLAMLHTWIRMPPGPGLQPASAQLYTWMSGRIRILLDRKLKALDFFNRNLAFPESPNTEGGC